MDASWLIIIVIVISLVMWYMIPKFLSSVTEHELLKFRVCLHSALAVEKIDADAVKKMVSAKLLLSPTVRSIIIEVMVSEGSKAIREKNEEKVFQLEEIYSSWYGENNRQNIHNQITERLLQTQITPFIADRKLDGAEIMKIKAEAFELGNTEYVDDAFIKNKFETYILNDKMENGVFEPVDSDYIMGKNEQCFYKEQDVEVLESKMVTSRVNYAGPVARIRLVKGIGFNLGSLAVAPSQERRNISLGMGVINVTNKRILFKGNYKIYEIRLSKIVDVEPYSDAVMIYKNTGNPMIIKTKKPEIFCTYLGNLMQA